MSDRRPHWDAELLDAVGRSMHAFYDRPDAMHVYAVIAAVEDWARWEHVPKGTLRRLEQAEAAIARVRDVCSQSRGVVHVGCRCFTDECSGTCGAGKPLAWNLDPTDVLLAMKGGGE